MHSRIFMFMVQIVLFNHKGAPTVSDMLSKLGVLARAAEYIDLSDPNEGVLLMHVSPDARFRAAKDPSKANDDGKRKKVHRTRRNHGVTHMPHQFGHLHVLFRDFSFEGNKKVSVCSVDWTAAI